MQIAIKHIPTDPSADLHFMKPPTQILTSVAVHRFAYANPEEQWWGWLNLKTHALVWEPETGVWALAVSYGEELNLLFKTFLNSCGILGITGMVATPK